MKIQIHRDAENDVMLINVVVPGQFIASMCKQHPFAHLIDTEQAFGIIHDAVLLAMGLEIDNERAYSGEADKRPPRHFHPLSRPWLFKGANQKAPDSGAGGAGSVGGQAEGKEEEKC